MGNRITRENHRVENIEISATSEYYYPPKSGNFFADHFTMGGEKFKATNPECFLFGENSDLAYLCNKAAQFPYKPPAGDEPSRSLRTLVHLRKDSLKITRASDSSEGGSQIYTVDFTVDCDVPCSIQVFLFASENLSKDTNQYVSRNPEWASELICLTKGTNQNFSSGNFKVNFDILNVAEFEFVAGAPEIPIVIQLSVIDKEFLGQQEVTFATFERVSDGSFSIKPLKQKIMVDGLCYVIEEIYGIENKNEDNLEKELDDDDLENGSECVICMCEMRDTLILPCRHLCLCNTCANSLRFQSSTCPICRSAFYALLQIKAVKRKTSPTKGQSSADEEATGRTANPVEYEEVPLIEALNGEMNRSNGDVVRRASSARRSAGKGHPRHGPRSAKSAAHGTRAHDPKHERSHSRTSVKDKGREDRSASKAAKADAMSCPNLRETALLMSANTSTDESDSNAPAPRSKSTYPKLHSLDRAGHTVLDCDSNDDLDESITLDEDIPRARPVCDEEPEVVVVPTPAKEVRTPSPVSKDEQQINDETDEVAEPTPVIQTMENPGTHIVLSEQLSNASNTFPPAADISSVSLPGTPMGSDDSSCSISSINFNHPPIAIVNPIYNAAATPAIANDPSAPPRDD